MQNLPHPLIAVLGTSFGDEGKGRVVHDLIEELRPSPRPVTVVMKVNGGANSGHTAAGLKLNLLPAGVADAGVQTLAIGCGVVADPRKFLWEALPLEAKGLQVRSRLVIDERCQLSDIGHRLLDLGWEHYRSEVLGHPARGSTARGISPSYADEAHHFQIYYADFLGSKTAFATNLTQRLNRACQTLQHVCGVTAEAWESFFTTLTTAETRANAGSITEDIFPESEFDFTAFKCPSGKPFKLNIEKIIDTYWEAGQALAPCISDVRETLRSALETGSSVLGEFGQAYWLDKRQGFPPNVTASHTWAAEWYSSGGLPMQQIHSIGCAKAYDTKVGTHTFLTQFKEDSALGQRLSTLEFGTSTGRQRAVGWFDCVEKGDCLRYGGFGALVINKLDALSGEAQLKICTAYQTPEGALLHSVPRSEALRKTLTPVYQTLPGWQEDISGIRNFAALPAAAQAYVAACVRGILGVANRSAQGTLAPPEQWHQSFEVHAIGVGPQPGALIRDVPPMWKLLSIETNEAGAAVA